MLRIQLLLQKKKTAKSRNLNRTLSNLKAHIQFDLKSSKSKMKLTRNFFKTSLKLINIPFLITCSLISSVATVSSVLTH